MGPITAYIAYGYFATIAVALLFFLLVLVLTWWLWNSTVTTVFGVRRLTLWEAFKILLLCTLLFGGGPSRFFPFSYSNSSTTTEGKTTRTVTYGINPPGK